MAGITTFLSKLGKYLAEGIATFAGIEPIVAPLFGANSKTGQELGKATNDLTQIGSIVVQAEAMFQGAGTGAAKLAAAAPLVANIVKTSELVSGKQIANQTLFIQGSTDLTNAVAEILNSLDAKAVSSSGTPIASVPAPSAPPAPAPPAPAVPEAPPTAAEEKS
jgi:hypothetical protein